MRTMTRGRIQGRPYCQLLESREMFKLRIKEAGDNPNSPCAKGTLMEVAAHAGCSHQFLQFLTSGRKNTCTPETADGIAHALGVRRDDLFVRKVSPLAVRTAKPRKTAVRKAGAAA